MFDMRKLIPAVLLTVTAGAAAAYAALQPANDMADRERIEHAAPLTGFIQFYTPPVMLYGKPIPRDPNAEMPDYAGLFQPFHDTPDY